MQVWTVSNFFQTLASPLKFEILIEDKTRFVGTRVAIIDIRLSKPAEDNCDVLIFSDLIVGRVIGTKQLPTFGTFSLVKGSRTVRIPKPLQYSKLVSSEPISSASFYIVRHPTLYY